MRGRVYWREKERADLAYRERKNGSIRKIKRDLRERGREIVAPTYV